jgi:hypothetical protein
MRQNIKQYKLLLLFVFFSFQDSNSNAQNFSIRTNILNLIAKGPSVTFGKYLKNNSEALLTFSSGHFAPFLADDYYKYSTVHIEYRKKNGYYLWGKFYYGGYLRFINKRIITEGYVAGPYGIFSKEARNFIGNGISIGLSTGTEWKINKRWILDFNNLIGAGKYVTQVDYAAHDKISFFLDARIALQIGYKF